MTKRKRWAIAFGFLSLCVFEYEHLVVEQAVASPLAPLAISSSIQDSNNIKSEWKVEPKISSLSKQGDDITLDQFIDDVIEKQELMNNHQNIINNELAKNEPYSVLKTDLLLKKEEFVNNKSIVLDASSSMEKIKKMQKLASYISNTYKVSLVKAENIVYSTFMEATKKNLEPTLILSIISIESMFNQYSKSHAGAVGLTQVMPNVHRRRIAENKVDIWSVHGNIVVGTDILKEYVRLAGGNVRKALQMYNGSSKDRKFIYSNNVMTKMQTFKVAAN